MGRGVPRAARPHGLHPTISTSYHSPVSSMKASDFTIYCSTKHANADPHLLLLNWVASTMQRVSDLILNRPAAEEGWFRTSRLSLILWHSLVLLVRYIIYLLGVFASPTQLPALDIYSVAGLACLALSTYLDPCGPSDRPQTMIAPSKKPRLSELLAF